MKAYDFVEQI